MKKQTTDNPILLVTIISLLIFLVSGIFALCFMHTAREYFSLLCVLCAVAGFFAVLYCIMLIVAAKTLPDGKGYFVLSWEVLVVSIVVIALSPIALILSVINAMRK